MPKFFNTRRRVKPGRIEQLENLIGLRFPDAYKSHLTKYNGGQCEPNVFSFLENGNETNSDVHQFLAIDGDEADDFFEYVNS